MRLGAVLYELLTGLTPFDRQRLYGAAFDQALHIIEAEEPPKPSQRLSDSDTLPAVAALRGTEPRRLPGLIRGELDWVVMKALEKDRARRYATAAGLAHDLENYLHDQPVRAGPPSAAYRFRKFTQRNKTLLATFTAIAAALMMGTGVAWWQAVRAHSLAVQAHEHADRADEEKSRAQVTLRTAMQAVNEIYTNLAERYLTTIPMMEPMKLEFLEAAVRFYGSFSAIHATDYDLRHERADAYARLGRCNMWLGRGPEAEAAYQEAIRGLEQLIAEAPGDSDHLSQLARCLVDLSELHDARDEHDQAEQQLERAFAILHGLQDTPLDAPNAGAHLAKAYSALGRHQEQRGLIGEAEANLRAAAALCEKLVATSPDDVGRQFQLALAYRDLGQVFERSEDLEAAAGWCEKAIRLQERIVTQPPVDPDYRVQLGVTHTWYGNLLVRLNRIQEAEAHLRQSLLVTAQIVDDFPHVPQYLSHWYDSYLGLVGLLLNSLRYDNAISTMRDVIEMTDRLAERWPDIHRFVHANCIGRDLLGFLLLQRWAFEEAEQEFRHVLQLAEELSAKHPEEPKYRWFVGRAMNELGLALRTTKGLAESEEAHRRARAVLEALVEAYPRVAHYRRDLAFSYGDLACVTQAADRLAEAEEYGRRCLALQRELANESPKEVPTLQYLARTYTWLGNLLRNTGRAGEAQQNYDWALELYSTIVATIPASREYQAEMAGTLADRILLANVYYALGRCSEAEQVCNEGLDICHSTLRDKFPDVFRIYHNVALIKFLHGDRSEADRLFSQMTEALRSALREGQVTPNDDRSDRARNLNHLAWLLVICPDSARRAPEEAVELVGKALDLEPGNGHFRNTLGVAQYRLGRWSDALESLRQAIPRPPEGNACDFFFLAMAHWQLGNCEESRLWYDRAVEWMRINAPCDAQFQIMRDEATALLGLSDDPQLVRRLATEIDATRNIPATGDHAVSKKGSRQDQE